MTQPMYPNIGQLSVGVDKGPVSKLEIWLECKGLLNKDVTSKSDPCAVMHLFQRGQWQEVKS